MPLTLTPRATDRHYRRRLLLSTLMTLALLHPLHARADEPALSVEALRVDEPTPPVDALRPLPAPSLLLSAGLLAPDPAPGESAPIAWAVSLSLAWPLAQLGAGAWHRARSVEAIDRRREIGVERVAELARRRSEIALTVQEDPLARALTRLRVAEIDAEIDALRIR